MKHYLSFGGGVNSVALHLLMIREKFDFEAIFVNHETDWPETYEYFDMFQNWLKSNGHKPVTVLKPDVHRKKIGLQWDNLVSYCQDRKIIPQQYPRWCTVDWKRKPIEKYVGRPCFMHIGIDCGESKRARIAVENGIENRYLLIEYGINRDGCKHIIDGNNLPVPQKSGCYICPFQTPYQWRQLRILHPELFCEAKRLEKQSGRTFRLNQPLDSIVNEDQNQLFEIDEYPPCQCGL